MSKVLIIGAGVGGLTTAMLLAHDGHDVTVIERDPAVPPDDPREAWTGWERRGVTQFRLPHHFAPGFRRLLEAELPDTAKALRAAGALDLNFLEGIPEEITGGARPGDEELVALTGRRSVIEAAIAGSAAATDRVTVRRGVAVEGLLTDGAAGVPHVTGVRTDAGEELAADLVLDIAGRRSPLPRWLEAVGAAPAHDEADELGFVYYGRHFRSADGSTPFSMGPPLQAYGSVSTLTLAADNGTWSAALIGAADDATLRAVRDPEVWAKVFSQYPLVAHWLDGEPIDDGVATMAKIEDRHRSLVVDGEPVVTGLLNVGDSWACTNPSLGRGATLALMHAVALRDTLHTHAEASGRDLALAFHEATLATVEPWYRGTLDFDRNRMAEVRAANEGTVAEVEPFYELAQAMICGATKDPTVLRVAMRVQGLLESPDSAFADPDTFARIIEVGTGWRDEPLPGPTRAELVALLGG